MLVGFTDVEGSFNLRFIKRATGRNQIDVRFRLTQHIRDLNLLTLITEYLGCGKIYMMSLANSLEVFSYSVIRTKIAPFFTKYPLETEKLKNFKDFTLVAEWIKNRDHLTPEGLAKIIEIKSNMNMNRTK